jgi:REP element-mobilizing transposase RayT
MKRQYERHLPHQIPKGVPIFLTWNLKGAFPKDMIERLREERARLARQSPRPGESPRDRRIREGKLAFLLADRHLDSCQSGPLYLQNPRAAEIVEKSILFGSAERYELYAWCVMGNHVHVLFTPRWEVRKITQGIKGYTAHEFNAIDGQQGRTLWQDESFDHWARDEEELIRIIHYIENNPVAAGLCHRPCDWRWSSARLRAAWPVGAVYVGQAFQPDKI